MTMCMGFACGNGLVIAADRQQTFPDGHTFHEIKVYPLKWKNGRAIWGYAADNSDTSKIIRETLGQRFSLEKAINRTEIKTVLTEILCGTLRAEEQFHMLFGGWTEGEHRVLLRANGTDVVYADRCEVIGSGDSSLSRFWRGLFLEMPLNPSIWQASVAAIYFIMQAKKYDGQFVGGGTDILVMADSPSNNLRVFSPELSERWEKRLELAEREMVRFLTSITFAEGITNTVEERLLFDTTLESFAAEIRVMK